MAEATSTQKEKKNFFRNVKSEFRKVVWPDANSVWRQALLIIVVTIILGVLVSLLDTGVSALIGLISGV